MRDLLRFLKAFNKWTAAGSQTGYSYTDRDERVDLNPNGFSKRGGLCYNAGRYDHSHAHKSGRMPNAYNQLHKLLLERYPRNYVLPFNEYVDDPMMTGKQRNTYYDDTDHDFGVMVNPRRRQFVIDTIAELSAKVKGR